MPEPPRARERIPTPTNYTESRRTATEINTIAKAARPTECVYCGETRAYEVGGSCEGCGATLPKPTELEKVLNKRKEVRDLLNRQYADAGLQRSQLQMDAMQHSLNQELAMITGMGQDPLQGAGGTPYWQQQFGEIGRNLGPFHPYDSPRPKIGLALGRQKSGK